ncbi:MAG: Ig-like domain-containing protein [Thermoanaerobaculia bacterium]
MNRSFRLLLAILLLLVSIDGFAQQKSVLFDAAHAQTAGNADWTLDEDSCGTAQRFPTPDQSGITSSTSESYWSGGMSAFGVDLVKKGFHVESLPIGARISWGDSSNPQDLSNYDVFVVPEPNVRFTSSEITAIRNFVWNGGGLMMIADHAGADRNNDGWDAAGIFDDLMGSPSVFGITFDDNKSDTTYGWFNDHPDGNFTTDPSSPIIYAGAFGVPASSKGLGLFGASAVTLSGAAKGHVWRTVATHDTSTGVTFATSTYGSGRVAAVGDSSTAEDATNGCGHKTYAGYEDPSYDNGLIIANAIAWLGNGSTSGGGGGTDTQAPATSVTWPSNGVTVAGTVTITASATDDTGVTKMEIWVDGALRTSNANSTSISWAWDTTKFANSSHTIASKAYDAAGNKGQSSNVTVTVANGAPQPQQLLGNPGFENGSSNPAPWSATSGVIDNSASEAAHSGSWKAWLDGYGSTHTDSVRQTVSIPSGISTATLSFWLHIDTNESGSTAYDKLKVQLRNSSGSVLTTLATYSNVNAASGYVKKSFDVSSYGGQTVQVYLVGTEDSMYATSFVVDDFALNVQ